MAEWTLVDLRLWKLRFAVQEGEKDIANNPDSARMRQSVFANIRVRVDELEAAMNAADVPHDEEKRDG